MGDHSYLTVINNYFMSSEMQQYQLDQVDDLINTDILRDKYSKSIIVPQSHKMRLDELTGKKNMKSIKINNHKLIADADGFITVDLPVGRYAHSKNRYLYVIFNNDLTVKQLVKHSADKHIISRYTYMNNTKLINEYLNQSETLIYSETDEQHEIVNWNHDQNNFVVLDMMMDIMDSISIDFNKTTDHSIQDIFNAIINKKLLVPCTKCDLKKVLKWTSTLSIIKAYLNTNKSVMFGKSWTFACVAVSLLRSIGIPARTVTMIKSDGSIKDSSIMKYFLEREDIPLDFLSDYYCWTEAYIDGEWHAFDSMKNSEDQLMKIISPKSKLMIEFDHRPWNIKANYE